MNQLAKDAAAPVVMGGNNYGPITLAGMGLSWGLVEYLDRKPAPSR